MSGSLAFDVVTVPIGRYDNFDAVEGVTVHAQRAAELLAEIGGRHVPWPGRPERVTQTEAAARLRDWESPSTPRSSALVWFGHGHSNGDSSFLAYAETSGAWTGAETPSGLATRIAAEWATRRDGNRNWAMIVIEACDAPAFVNQLISAVHGLPHGTVPGELVCVAAGSDGTARLGAFNECLAATVASLRDEGPEFELSEFVRRLHNRLSNSTTGGFAVHFKVTARLRLRDAPATGITATADDSKRLREFLTTRPPALRHFDDKARGADLGEQTWFFTGRRDESRRIARWLRTRESGMFVVTGPPGAGKSALLGHLAILADEQFRGLLLEAGQLEAPDDDEVPPDGCFDVVVHLAGLSVTDVVERLCEAAGVPLGEDRTMESLRARLRHDNTSFTVLADALDEAREPLAVASTVLCQIADLPGCRVVVGTRANGPGSGHDLIAELGCGGGADNLTVTSVPDDLGRYVRRRLIAARVTGTPALTDTMIDRIAALVRDGGQNFLSARIAIAEILARPELLRPENADELRRLTAQHHESTFTAILDRMAVHTPRSVALLHALALGHGQGLPRSGGVWAKAATALSDHGEVNESDIDDVLHHAGALIMLDAPAGQGPDAHGGQTTYRLAHRTFQEHFTSVHAGGSGGDGPERRVALALLELADEETAERGPGGGLSPYLAGHLAAHVSAAGAWSELATAEAVLDRLDPGSVRDQALRGAFGRRALPPAIVGVLAAWRELAAVPPGDRAFIRTLAGIRATGIRSTARTEDETWRLAWANLPTVPLSVSLGDGVLGVATVELPGHGPLLASLDEDGTVSFWNNVSSAEPISGPLAGRTPKSKYRLATELAAFTLPGGRPVLVRLDIDDEDQLVQIWDMRTWQRFGATGDALSVTRPDGRRAYVCNSPIGTVHFVGSEVYKDSHELVDPAFPRYLVDPSFSEPLCALAVLPDHGGELILVRDGQGDLWLWSTDATRVAGPYRTAVFGAETEAGLDDRLVLRAKVRNGKIQVVAAADPRGHDLDLPYGLAVLPPPGSGEIPDSLIVNDRDRQEFVLISLTEGRPKGRSLAGDRGRIETLLYGTRILALRHPDHEQHDSPMIMLWDPATGDPVWEHALKVGVELTDIVVVSISSESMVLAVRDSGKLWLHRLDSAGKAEPQRIALGKSRYVTAHATVPLPDGTVALAVAHDRGALLSEDRDRVIQLWDVEANRPLRRPWRRLRFRDDACVIQLAPVADRGGRTLVLVQREEYRRAEQVVVEVWNLETRRRVGPSQEFRRVRSFEALPGSNRGRHRGLLIHTLCGSRPETVAYDATSIGRTFGLRSPLTHTRWAVSTPADVVGFVRGADGTLYAVAVDGHCLVLIDAHTGAEHGRLTLDERPHSVHVLGTRILVGVCQGVAAVDVTPPTTGTGAIPQDAPEEESAVHLPLYWKGLLAPLAAIMIVFLVGLLVYAQMGRQKKVEVDAISGVHPLCSSTAECNYRYLYVVKQQTQTTIYRVPSDHPYFTAELSVRSTGPCDTDARVHYTFTSGDNRNSGQLAIGAERALHTWPHGNGDRVTLTFSANRACAPVLMVGFPAVHRWKISIL